MHTLSKTSALFVDPNTRTPSLVAIPSISTRSWFSVCSPSPAAPSADPDVPLRFRPIASISSMYIMHGARFFASLNKSLIKSYDK